MTITDKTKGIKLEVTTSICTTMFELSGFELAAMIGQYMGKHELTDEQFIKQFFAPVKEK